MKVMIRQSRPERPSSRNARSIFSGPAEIQVPTVSRRPPLGAASGSAEKNASAATRHDAGDGAGSDRQDRVARPLAAEQHQDRGAEERQQRNEAKVESHDRVSLSASSR